MLHGHRYVSIANAASAALPCFVRIVVCIGIASSWNLNRAHSQSIDLGNSTWTLLGQDIANWNGSRLTFVSQDTGGALAGYFDWVSAQQGHYGREIFDGMLAADRTFTLHGYQLAPHPVFGGPSQIVLTDYFGRITPDGKRIVDGTWISRQGIRGTWESVFEVPEPSAGVIIMAALGCWVSCARVITPSNKIVTLSYQRSR